MPEPKQQKIILTVVIALCVVCIAALAYYFWPKSRPPEYLRTLRLPKGHPTSVVFTGKHKLICVGTSRGQVYGWKYTTYGTKNKTKQTVIEQQTEGLITTLLDSGGGLLLGGDSQGNLLGWSLTNLKNSESPQELSGFPAPITAIGVRTAPQSEMIIGLASGYICFLAKGEKPKVLPVHKGAVKAIAVHPVQPVVVSADAAGRVLWWDMEQFKVRRISKKHQAEVQSLCYSPDGDRLASGDWNGEIIIWDVESRTETNRLKQPDAVAGLCWIDEDLMTGSWDGYVRRWSLAEGKIIKEINADSAIQDLALSPDKKSIVIVPAAADVELWRVPK